MPTDDLVARYQNARRDRALAVIEGFHALKHAIRFRAAIEHACAPDRERIDRLAAAVAPDVRPWIGQHLQPVAEAVFLELSPYAADMDVVAIAARPHHDPQQILNGPDTTPIVLLDNPTHHGNVGASVRVAAAAEAGALVTTGRLDPWHPAAIRGSAGLHFAVPVARCGMLPGTERPLVAIDPAGEPIDAGAIPKGAVLAFGSERHGLSADVRNRATRTVAIPMRKGVSSLNLATSVAVVLFALRLGAV